jgi:hypothetical protein
VAQPCVGNGNVKCGGAQALKVPAYIENVFELLGSEEYGAYPAERASVALPLVSEPFANRENASLCLSVCFSVSLPASLGAGHPGDFYLDASEGFVYYVPNAGETLGTTQGVLPAVEALVVADQVTGQTYTNIVFEHATWMQPSTSAGFVEVQSGYCLTCPNEAVDHCRDCSLAVHHDPTPAAVRFRRASNISFSGCTFRHIVISDSL